MKLLICAMLMALLMGCDRQDTSTEVPATADKTLDPQRIDQVLHNFVANGELVGVSALVYREGQEAYFGAHGAADRERGVPMARDTLVQIYSMTKPITGTVLMSLYEEGKFQLDDPLADYLPEFADMTVYAGEEDGQPVYEDLQRPITVRDILRHTAGFYGGNEPSPVGDLYREADPLNLENTLSDLGEKLSSVPLLYQPGSRWLYGISVDVQALLAERLAGQPFDQLLQERIFDPLQMHDTGYLVPEDDRHRLSAMYTRNEDGSFTQLSDEEGLANNINDWPLKLGGWRLASTLDDYMRFARMLLNGGELDGVRILESDTVELMATDMLPDTVTDKSWLPSKGQVGFGINFAVRLAPPADHDEASGAVGEFFWDGAANTLFWVDPKNEIVAVLFTQYQPYGGVSLHKDFRDAVYRNDPVASALARSEEGEKLNDHDG